MNSFIDNLYGVIFTPSEAMKKITREKPMGQGLIVLILSTLLPMLSTSRTFVRINQLQHTLPPEIPHITPIIHSMGPFLLIIAAITIIIFKPLITFLFTALIHMISEFLGGEGEGKGLFTGFCFASFPSILMAPIHIINNFTSFNIASIFNFALLIWVIVLQVIAVKQNNNFSTSRAVLTYTLPWLMLLAAVIVMLVITISILSAMIPVIEPFLREMQF